MIGKQAFVHHHHTYQFKLFLFCCIFLRVFVPFAFSAFALSFLCLAGRRIASGGFPLSLASGLHPSSKWE